MTDDAATFRRHENLYRAALPNLERHALSVPRLCSWIDARLAELQLFPAALAEEKYVPQITVFTSLCAPRVASARGLQHAAEFLFAFFVLNDAAHGEEAPDVTSRRDFIERWLGELELEYGARATRFKDAFALYRASLVHERLLDERKTPITWSKYTDRNEGRHQWVATAPYLELWELCEGVVVPDEERAACDELKATAVDLTYVANDLGSFGRDGASKNFVSLIADQAGCQRDEALRATVEFYVAQAQSFAEQAAALSPATRSYVDLLAWVTDGNLRATSFLATGDREGRYAPEVRELLEELAFRALLVPGSARRGSEHSALDFAKDGPPSSWK